MLLKKTFGIYNARVLTNKFVISFVMDRLQNIPCIYADDNAVAIFCWKLCGFVLGHFCFFFFGNTFGLLKFDLDYNLDQIKNYLVPKNDLNLGESCIYCWALLRTQTTILVENQMGLRIMP